MPDLDLLERIIAEKGQEIMKVASRGITATVKVP